MSNEFILITATLFTIVCTFFHIRQQSNEIKELKNDKALLLDQISHMGKMMNDNKVRSYKRVDLNLKQAMIQRTQSDIASRLQSYLSSEGLHE